MSTGNKQYISEPTAFPRQIFQGTEKPNKVHEAYDNGTRFSKVKPLCIRLLFFQISCLHGLPLNQTKVGFGEGGST